ncbi:arginine N-succinyltransferase [Noviherbaspirillum denitrificans]|uniref:Arginine N-succinyltransferase n=1 Tax=Noviherbaspirillum denitrificans TaxID=1968433 RepID=A0A254TAE4_9BURK|nr:arginine N-succinyltransferase [Noviherbaspirillum denitrificans]OWW19616.1 arginine N-succinyltransferase [Noviherbaspirillum denitrificans]
MYVVRPVEAADIPALEAMANVVTPGVHTLPRTRATIELAVERSVASFKSQPDVPTEESYFFVLQSVKEGTIAGTAAIAATAGASGTFFAFRNDVLSQVSRDLNISHNVHALTLCSDLTACSQLSSFYLRNRVEAGDEAALLSRTRLLFAAVAPHRFGEKFFASMSGITDANGRSPFWEALGRKFFQMDFLEAERMIEGARNRTLIVELMPHYPVYVPLLPGDAQAAMGQVHTEGELPFHILTDEGFQPDEYIDIFDGGPILQAHKNALRSFSQSAIRTVAARTNDDSPSGEFLVATVREERFRAVMCAVSGQSDLAALDEQAMRALDVAPGDSVLCVKL